jgi:hypothetical protein
MPDQVNSAGGQQEYPADAMDSIRTARQGQHRRCQRHRRAGHPRRRGAAVDGLAAGPGGRMLRVQIPFGWMLLLVILPLVGQERLWRTLRRINNHFPKEEQPSVIVFWFTSLVVIFQAGPDDVGRDRWFSTYKDIEVADRRHVIIDPDGRFLRALVKEHR